MTLYIDPSDKPQKKKPQMTKGARRAKARATASRLRVQSTLLTAFVGKILSILFMGMVLGGIAISLTLLWFSQGLPDLGSLAANTRKPSVTIQTFDGAILGSYGDVYEDMLLVSELPDYVPKALMAVEDRRFEYHFGVDFIGLFRAAYANYQAKRVVQGGSTLTQQLAKNILQKHGIYGIDDRSMKRKIQEVMIALWLEWKFTKPQIMTMYLNRVCFGGTIFGVDAAARVYFNKSARTLTVFEAALIAGLLKAPSRYSPAHHPKKAIERATVVLKLMEEAGFITDYQKYVKQGEVDLASIQVNQGKGGRYFADWVYESLPSYLGPITKDLIVITTLDTAFQRHAELMVKHFNETMGKELRASQIAFVAMAPDGAVKAMIGGRSYAETQFNRATQALRQAGSTFKTFVYLAAMESGMNPDTMIDDTPITIGKWSPSNFKYIAQGQVSLLTGFQKSINSISVRLAQQVGIGTIADVAERLGISNCPRGNLSISLGAVETTLLDLTAAHAAFANRGYRAVPYGVAEIRDKEGNILYQQTDEESLKVIETQPLSKMRTLLRGVVEGGSGRAANIDESVSGKTGSNGDKDAWFVFYRENPDEHAKGFNHFVGGVWVGNDNNADMAKRSTGGFMPTRVAKAIMEGPNTELSALVQQHAAQQSAPKQDAVKTDTTKDVPVLPKSRVANAKKPIKNTESSVTKSDSKPGSMDLLFENIE